jgi:hypothetical protein
LTERREEEPEGPTSLTFRSGGCRSPAPGWIYGPSILSFGNNSRASTPGVCQSPGVRDVVASCGRSQPQHGPKGKPGRDSAFRNPEGVGVPRSRAGRVAHFPLSPVKDRSARPAPLLSSSRSATLTSGGRGPAPRHPRNLLRWHGFGDPRHQPARRADWRNSRATYEPFGHPSVLL